MGGTLHPKWEEILRYLVRRAGAGGPPSLRELATAVGLRSSQTAHHHLRKLEEDSEHEELLPPSEGVWVRGLVEYVVHLPNKRADGGGA